MDIVTSESGNVATPEVRAQLERILRSEAFHKKDKLVSFLTYVVETTLAGEAHRIKQYSIGVDALGYGPDDCSDVTVRAHALRLRQALEAYYAAEGRTDPIRIDVPKGQYVPVFSASKPSETSAPVRQPRPERLWRVLTAAMFSTLAVVAAFAFLAPRQAPPPAANQLTFFSGATESAAPSWDGRLIAFASDRAADGGKDIWLRRKGQPAEVRLTNHPADDYDPDISPDGKWVVFRSMRDGGGVYIVSTSGGAARRLNSGFSPRFSPDGRRFAYTAIEHSGNAAAFVAPVDGGGEPVKVSRAPLLDAGGPVWSPDGQHLLVRGLTHPSGGRSIYDLWLLSTNPDIAPVSAGAAKTVLPVAGELNADTLVGDWVGDRVLIAMGGTLLELTFDRSGQIAATARVLSAGPHAYHPRYLMNGRQILAEFRNDFTDIWGLQGDFEQGKPSGPRRQQWTSDQTLGWARPVVFTSLSADGSKLAYASRSVQPERGFRIVVVDVKTGERNLIRSPARVDHFRPTLNPAGSHVAFGERAEASTSIQIAEVSSGAVRVVCSNCGEIRHWSADGKRILAVRDRALVEIAAAGGGWSARTVGEGADWEPEEAAYSPDGKWIALVAGVKGKTKLQGVILPSSGAPPEQWIPITEELYNLALHWSPGGNLVYYFSRRDDYRCLWAQRLDPRSKRPIGQPLPVEHFHTSGQRVNGMGWASVSRDWIGVNLSRSNSNLYTMPRPD